MISFTDGDFFDYDADIRVNTVNCVGVMGAGVALLFKNKYPKMFQLYKKQCQQKEIMPGIPSVWHEGDMFSKGITIINFPTKDHWKKPSKYEYIESGLVWLRDYLNNKDEITITIPALGCGHGRLDWNKVKILISKYLGDLNHNIIVFNPNVSKAIGKRDFDPVILEKLSELDIKLYEPTAYLYPQKLKKYTEKNLYVYGDHKLDFNIALICSSRPSELERSLVLDLMEFCLDNSLSILLGSSVFEKKLAIKYASNGLNVGNFLPSGITESVGKLSSRYDQDSKLTLLSMGNPFNSFDKKEFLPSVFGRISIARKVVFTTPKLSWLKKHTKFFSNNKGQIFFVDYVDLGKEDKEAIILFDSEPVIPSLRRENYLKLKQP